MPGKIRDNKVQKDSPHLSQNSTDERQPVVSEAREAALFSRGEYRLLLLNSHLITPVTFGYAWETKVTEEALHSISINII